MIVPVKGHSIAPAIFVHTALFVDFSIAYISKYRTFLLEATNWSIGIARVGSVPVFISAVVASSTHPTTVREAERYILVVLDISLFVILSVVAFHTRVSLAPVGNVSTQPDTVIAEKLGVVSAGELENTRTHPLPVSSLITVASCAEVVEAN